MKTNIAHNWANQINQIYKKDTGEGSNFYFKGKTIYSYGSHFPIATLTGENNEVCIFTLCRYSKTTAKHLIAARSASSHKTKIYCKNVLDAVNGRHGENFDFWLLLAEEQGKKLLRANKPQNYISELNRLKAEIQVYCNYFEVSIPVKLDKAVNVANKEEFSSYVSEVEELNRQIQKQREKEDKKKVQADLKKWRAGKLHRLYARIGYDYLRYNKENNRIETSQAVEIPAEVAKRFYLQAMETIKTGGCSDCGTKLLDYEVKAINKDFIQIGCHKIALKEVKMIAKQLGW